MDTKAVAVGSIYTMLSRLVVLICGFVVTITLARYLGPVSFGLYSLILSILVWVEYTVSMGIPSAYRKIISENQDATSEVLSATNKISLPYCLVVAAVFSMLSPLIALSMSDYRLTLLLAVSSLDIPFFGLYATHMSILNGRGRFLSQSLLVVVYSISRTALIVVAAVSGFGVIGALIGNAMGSLCGLLMAFYLTRRLIAKDREETSHQPGPTNLRIRQRLATYGLPYLSIFLIASLLIHMDIWLIKALTEDKATVNALVGFYAVSYNLARIPFFLIGAITYTVFPAISMATFENRRSDTLMHIRHSLRMALIIVLPMVAVVLATGDKIVVFLFSSTYEPAIQSFKILLGGVSLFSVFLFFVNIISAGDRQRIGLLMSLLLIPVAGVLHYFLIPAHGIEGAAAATTLVSLLGVTISGIYVWKRFGPIVRAGDLVKVIFASTCLYFLSSYEPLYQYHLILGYILVSIAYLLLLLTLRVIEINTIKELIRTPFRSKKSES